MQIAIYSRKSVFTGKGESIENQIEMCKQYIFLKIDGASEKNITIYEDEGFSAKNTNRPQFQKLIKDIKQKKYNYVVCYRLDRISRNVSDFAALIEDLNNLNISFICVKEEFDTSKPMGKAMMYIASVFSQLERETLAERVRDNMFMLARTGRWLGGTPPTGFVSEKIDKIDIDGKIKTACKLKFDTDEIEIVKVIYNKFLELQSISGVSKYLIKENIKSRTGKWFSLLGIKQILSNPVYCIADNDARNYFLLHNSDVCFKKEECSGALGLLSYNKRDCKKKNAPRHERSEWIIAIGRHNGIVSGKFWATAQDILDSGKPGNNIVKIHNEYSLLSGMIFCCKCKSKMFAKMRCTNTDKLFDYICNNKIRGGKKTCDGKNLNGSQADEIVSRYLLDFANGNANIFMLLENLKKDLYFNEKSNPITEIETRINRCNSEIENLIKTLSRSDVNSLAQHVNTKINELDAEINRLTEKKNRLKANALDITANEAETDAIANSLSCLKTYFTELTIQEKRTLIKLLAKKIEWDGQNIHIFVFCEQQPNIT